MFLAINLHKSDCSQIKPTSSGKGQPVIVLTLAMLILHPSNSLQMEENLFSNYSVIANKLKLLYDITNIMIKIGIKSFVQ